MRYSSTARDRKSAASAGMRYRKVGRTALYADRGMSNMVTFTKKEIDDNIAMHLKRGGKDDTKHAKRWRKIRAMQGDNS